MKIHQTAIRRCKDRKKFLLGLSFLELSILLVLIVSGSAAAFYGYESTHKPLAKVATNTANSSSSETQQLTLHQPSPSDASSTPQTSTSKTTSNSTSTKVKPNLTSSAPVEPNCSSINNYFLNIYQNGVDQLALVLIKDETDAIQSATQQGWTFPAIQSLINEDIVGINSSIAGEYNSYASDVRQDGCTPSIASALVVPMCTSDNLQDCEAEVNSSLPSN